MDLNALGTEVHDDHVATSNIIWKFDEEILRNDKIMTAF